MPNKRQRAMTNSNSIIGIRNHFDVRSPVSGRGVQTSWYAFRPLAMQRIRPTTAGIRRDDLATRAFLTKSSIRILAMAHFREATTVTGTSLFGLGFLFRAKCVEFLTSHAFSPGNGGSQCTKTGF